MINELQTKLAIQQAVNGAKIQEATILSELKSALATYEAKVDAEMSAIRSALKIAEHKAKQAPYKREEVAASFKEVVKDDIEKTSKEIAELGGKVIDITRGVKELATAVEKSAAEKSADVNVEYDDEGRIISVNGKKIKRSKKK